jgi:hypothetical protein
MKTKIYTPTVLALLIQVIGMSQTSTHESYTVNGSATFITSEPANKQVSDYSRLVNAADYYDKSSKKIKDESPGRQSLETELMIVEAVDFGNTGIMKQIEASKLAGIINQKAFNQNSKLIAILFAAKIKDMDSKDQATNYVMDANIAMRSAKLMREEATQMTNLAAILGYMGNAEEKEFIALTRQEKAIGVLEKATVYMVFEMEESLAVK